MPDDSSKETQTPRGADDESELPDSPAKHGVEVARPSASLRPSCA